MADAARNGDEKAQSLYNEFGHHLGAFLSVVMYAYDANRIVLGGGIAHSFELFKGKMWETLRSFFPYQNTLDDLQILAMPGDDVALVGAASL